MNSLRQLLPIWLAWSLIITGYMSFTSTRFKPERPDLALPWTATETRSDSNSEHPYLLDPTLNALVAWDSEYYLGIATTGYEDISRIPPVEAKGEVHSKSYAYFPLYPSLMKLLRWPFTLLGFSEIGASTVAGVLISLLGTLAGMVGIYDLARAELGHEGAIRAAYMMLIFPVSFFFAVVYTEGLFVGLAFGSLALLHRKQWAAAALLAALATWTRSVGAVLLLPLLLAWALEFFRRDGGWNMPSWSNPDQRHMLKVLPILFAPFAAYVAWRIVFGTDFDFVQVNYFGNKLFGLHTTREAWKKLLSYATEHPEARFNATLALSAIALAFLSCIWYARRYPLLTTFGFLALIIPITSGGASVDSALRYVLVLPTLWILLGRMTAHPVVDRSWSLLSILLLGIQAYLFSTDMWSS